MCAIVILAFLSIFPLYWMHSKIHGCALSLPPLALPPRFPSGLGRNHAHVFTLVLFRRGRGLSRLLPGEREPLLHNRKLQPALLRQNTVQNPLPPVAGPKLPTPPPPHNLMRILAP